MSGRQGGFAERSFSADVRAAVADHFRRCGLSPKGDRRMVARALVLGVATVAVYALILAPGAPLLVRWLGCVLLGFCLAGVGMGIGHDALHGAYSPRARTNRLLGLVFDLIGASSYVWRFTHNRIHHAYTNIEGADLDIDYDPVLRMSPGSRRRWHHRWQHLYAIPLYALAGLHWVFVKDFDYLRRGRLGPLGELRHSWRAWAGVLLGRAFVAGYLIVVPTLVLAPAWWQLAIGYVTVNLVAGLTLALVFQLAHAVDVVSMGPPTGERGDPLVHQLRTTANFACGNRLLSWYVGGLNFQVEHHLFPHVCSVHYPALRPIVRASAARHGLPYHEFPSLTAGLRSHLRHLRALGCAEAGPAPLGIAMSRQIRSPV